jgi:peptidoglycan-associated lipoprotein
MNSQGRMGWHLLQSQLRRVFMKRTIANASGIITMAMLLLLTQGCGMKWMQSGGENDSGAAASHSKASASDAAAEGRSADFPSLLPGGSSGELSGLSRNPSEERLAMAQGGVAASLSPSEAGTRRRAELTKEEKAALEAGLQDVFFAYDQWRVSSVGMESLNRDARYLKDHPGAVLKIEGHCDERGTTDYNMVLGDKRAKAVRTYLIEAGVSPKQVSTVSFGKERPFCFDHDESCHQQNRRGHVLLSTQK